MLCAPLGKVCPLVLKATIPAIPSGLFFFGKKPSFIGFNFK
jgi:hypothetical protein